jgi:hypothetical protein
MAGRQEEEQQKRRVADQLRLVQERGKLSQQQAGAKQAQEAQSKQQEAEAYIGALEGSLNAETHPAVRQRVEAGIQMLRKGGDPKVVEKLVPWLDPPKVDIRQHEGVYEPIDPYTGKPTQPARALKGPQAPKTSIEAGRQIDTPGQAPYAGLVSEFPAQQAPSVTELPETAKEKQLREEKMTEEERRYQRNLEDRREDRQQAVLDRRATIAAGAAAGREARAEAKSNEPVGKDAALWMKRDGTGPVDPRTPMREVMEIAVPVTQSGVNAAASAKTALETLQEYRSLVKKLLPKSTGDSAKDLYAVQGNRAKLFLLEKAGNPDARRFSALKGTLATQARATGDTANIAVKERELLESFMATTGDTQESAEAVLNQAERILRSVAEGRGVPTKPPAVTAPGEDKEKQKKSGKGWREK